jgi:hypothetical protein
MYSPQTTIWLLNLKYTYTWKISARSHSENLGFALLQVYNPTAILLSLLLYTVLLLMKKLIVREHTHTYTHTHHHGACRKQNNH